MQLTLFVSIECSPVENHVPDFALAPGATSAILFDANRALPLEERALNVLVPRIFFHILIMI